MRTKQCLAALCLPLAFAACSNEDFVTETPSLSNRGAVNVTINAQKPSFNDADTRMSIDGNNKFLWEKEFDVIGAAMADGAVFGTIANKVFVNYPFTAQSNGTTSAFNAKSSISKGNYLFYYGYTDVLDRELLDLSVPAQKYDVASEKTPIQQAANQMKMISPIVNLANGVGYVDAQDYNLNLSFANLYTMVKVTINSKNFPNNVTPKVEKITLNATTGGFVKQAYADMTVIDNAGIVTPDTETKQIKEADMTAAIAGLNELISGAVDGTVSTIYNQDGLGNEAKNGPAVLSVNGDLALSTAEATVLYILAPKGKYNGGLTLTVETSEGTYTKSITQPAGKDLILADDIQKIGADLDFSLDGTGNVKLPEEFAIASTEDWTHAVEFVTNHSVAYINKGITFKLAEDIEIPALPTFKLTINGTQTLTLASNYTINDKNANQFTATNITLGVKAGATLTLDNATTAFAGFENNGTLNVNAAQSKAITNYGTMNVNADLTLTGGVTNGKAKTQADPAVAGTINIVEGKKLTFETTALSNLVGDVNVNGTLILTQASTSAATITVSKKGVLEGAGGLTNTGTVDNFGALKATVTNEGGTIIAEDGGVSNNSATINKGTVIVKNVTTFATTQSGASKYTFGTVADAPVVTTVVNSAAEYAKADAAASGITNITLNGGEWTLAGSAGDDASKTVAVPSNASGLTLQSAVLNLSVALADKEIIADGVSSIKAASPLSITGAKLTVNAGAALTVNNNVTVNALATATATDATILGTLNVEAGAKMYFANVTVGSTESSAGVVAVKGNTATNVAPGEFGVKTTFANYGMVQSLSGTNAVAAAGKVSQPINKTNDAVFKGNAETFTFQ